MVDVAESSLAEPRPGLVAVDADGRVDGDLPCGGCGYNLRMQPVEGECPECGARVKRAIWIAGLRTCDPRWLRRIAAGFRWLTIGLLCLPLFGVALYLGGRFFRGGDYDTIAALLIAAPGATLPVMICIGVWLLTRPAPAGTETPWIRRWRLSSRVLLPVAAAVFFVALASWSAAPGVSEAAMLVAMLAGLLGAASFLLMMERLASRLRALALLWLTRLLTAGLVVSVGLLVTGLLLREAVALGRDLDHWLGPPPTWLMNLSAVFSSRSIIWQGWNSYEAVLRMTAHGFEPFLTPWPGLVFLLLWSGLMLWYRARFRDAARTAGVTAA